MCICGCAYVHARARVFVCAACACACACEVGCALVRGSNHLVTSFRSTKMAIPEPSLFGFCFGLSCNLFNLVVNTINYEVAASGKNDLATAWFAGQPLPIIGTVAAALLIMLVFCLLRLVFVDAPAVLKCRAGLHNWVALVTPLAIIVIVAGDANKNGLIGIVASGTQWHRPPLSFCDVSSVSSPRRFCPFGETSIPSSA